MYIGVYMPVCACPGVYHQMNKENVILIHNRILCGNKEKSNHDICRKMDIT